MARTSTGPTTGRQTRSKNTNTCKSTNKNICQHSHSLVQSKRNHEFMDQQAKKKEGRPRRLLYQSSNGSPTLLGPGSMEKMIGTGWFLFVCLFLKNIHSFTSHPFGWMKWWASNTSRWHSRWLRIMESMNPGCTIEHEPNQRQCEG